MCNNIKSKALGVRIRSLLLVFLLIISISTMVACDDKEDVVTTQEFVVTTQEFELVSCYIEYRNITNGFGGVVRIDEYLHYSYVDKNGKVIFEEKTFGSYLNFQVTEETPKYIIETDGNNKTYTFQLTREMYKNINDSQQ